MFSHNSVPVHLFHSISLHVQSLLRSFPLRTQSEQALFLPRAVGFQGQLRQIGDRDVLAVCLSRAWRCLMSNRKLLGSLIPPCRQPTGLRAGPIAAQSAVRNQERSASRRAGGGLTIFLLGSGGALSLGLVSLIVFFIVRLKFSWETFPAAPRFGPRLLAGDPSFGIRRLAPTARVRMRRWSTGG